MGIAKVARVRIRVITAIISRSEKPPELSFRSSLFTRHSSLFFHHRHHLQKRETLTKCGVRPTFGFCHLHDFFLSDRACPPSGNRRPAKNRGLRQPANLPSA